MGHMNQRTISDVLLSLSELHVKVDRLLDKSEDARTVAATVMMGNHDGCAFVPTEKGLRELKEDACGPSPCSTCS